MTTLSARVLGVVRPDVGVAELRGLVRSEAIAGERDGGRTGDGATGRRGEWARGLARIGLGWYAVKVRGVETAMTVAAAAVAERLGGIGLTGEGELLVAGTVAQIDELIVALRAGGADALGEMVERAVRHYTQESAGVTHIGGRGFVWGERTYVMGIVNVTPDSFSGDGIGCDPELALEQARGFVAAGADLIDVGGESTRPGHAPVDAAKERRRVVPVVERLAAELDVPISIDTFKAEVAAAALDAGADLVNSVWSLAADPELGPLVAERGVPLVLMHNQKGTEYRDLMGEVTGWLQRELERAVQHGIAWEQLVVDPGIGFGKTMEHNLEIMARLDELRSLGRPILFGSSRKSTIGYVLDAPADDRLEGTAATNALAIARGADVIRVHDVRALARVAKMTDAIVRRGWWPTSF